MDTLKARLRLEGATSTGAQALIDQAVEDARILFYGRLTAATVTMIKATAYTETPSTDAQLLRTLANSVEIKVVRRDLLRSMPTLFLDSAGRRLQQFNDEAAFVAQRNLRDELARLDDEIEEGLQKLAGEEGLDEQGSIEAVALAPDDTPDLPGATIWESMRRSSAWPTNEVG